MTNQGALTLLEALRRLLKGFDNDVAQRAFSDIAQRVQLARERGDRNFRQVTYEGGWPGMCKAIGIKANASNAAALRAMASAGAGAFGTIGDDTEWYGLWTWDACPRRGRLPAFVRFVAGEPFTESAR